MGIISGRSTLRVIIAHFWPYLFFFTKRHYYASYSASMTITLPHRSLTYVMPSEPGICATLSV